MFDLESLKDKLDGETLSALKSHVDDLAGSRDAAKRESIDGRKALKAKVDELQSANSKILEKLGIDSVDDLENLPDPKAVKTEADTSLKQFEARLKRAEREREEAVKASEALKSQMTQARKQAAIAQAISAGGFHDSEAAELLLSSRIEQQDEEFLFKTRDGRFIPLSDGAKLIATEKPHLVKAPQGTGSGFRDAGSAAAKTMPKAIFDALKPAERAQKMSEGFTLTES
jgi:hypothetical protein